jgi:hypothetical protein
MSPMRAAALPLVALVLLLSDADAQQLPTDTELRAAYCVGFANAAAPTTREIESDRNTPASVRLVSQKHREDTDRMRRYLLPRMYYIDTISVVAAMGQGKSDWFASMRRSETCASECEAQHLGTAEAGGACMHSCIGNDDKFAKCRDTSWLPY